MEEATTDLRSNEPRVLDTIRDVVDVKDHMKVASASNSSPFHLERLVTFFRRNLDDELVRSSVVRRLNQ